MTTTFLNKTESLLKSTNIEYPNTDQNIPFSTSGKPQDSWMRNWTQEERLEKFYEYLYKFNKREDKLLRDEFQIFSHRVSWAENPFTFKFKDAALSLEEKIALTIHFSFSNEKWTNVVSIYENGWDSLYGLFDNERAARSDLFQIYHVKGTKVREWLITEPRKIAKILAPLVLEHCSNRGRFTMMGFAKMAESVLKSEFGFRSPLYPCKNAARYLAMTWPELVDPTTPLYGGTGHFDGMMQIFGSPYLNGKVKYSVSEDGEFVPENKHAQSWLDQMEILVPIVEEFSPNPWLDGEDKTCFMFKHIAISHGIKKPTKRIPREWIVPEDFSFKI